ncbi:4329_t:CDS:2, partial [Diversispora eburnea]
EQNLSVDKWDVIIVQVESLSCIEFSSCLIIVVLDEVNAIQRQMNNAQYVLAMDAFANESILTFLKAHCGENIRVIDNKFQPLIGKTIEYLPDSNTGAEAMRIGFEYLMQGKRVAFVITSSNIARALVEKAFKLSFKAPYINTVEAGISFEKPNHFDIVIGITNIATPVNVEAFIQMMFRIRDCKKRILSLYYQKISNEFSRSPGHENIHIELAVAQPNDLPTAIKGHCEWDIDSISYKLDQSPAITSFIEVEHQKRLSARNFIEISCSLIASTEARICKKVRNEIKAEVSVIKHTDFEAVATSRNLTPKEAKILKLDSECSVVDTMTLKHFYMWNLYSGNDMSQDLVQWEDICYNAKDNFEDSVAKDLRKTYSANHWEAVRGLLQSLGFTALLLFGFRSHAKEMPDLKSAVKAINAIVEEVIARKLDNSEYYPIVPILPSYKPKVSDEIQDFFDSIPITNNTTLEYAEREISDSSSNAIDEKALFLPEAVTQRLKIISYQNESDIDILIHLLQQKFQMSQEKLDQWRFKIALEMWDNQNYWKKEHETMNEIDFLNYKQKFEAKMKVPTTSHKKELKNKSLAFIEYA